VNGGRTTFEFTVRPVVSKLAAVRGKTLVLDRFPSAQLADLPWRDYQLTWPDRPSLVGLPLKPPLHAAWDVNLAPSRFTVGPLDADGLGTFAVALTGGRTPLLKTAFD
jgi:hypothetical protein